MKRAQELFTFEELPLGSPLVGTTWRTSSGPEPDEAMISSAVSQWEIVVTRQAAGCWLTLRGPETKASTAPIPRDARFFGITFSHGTYMPHLPMRRLVDSSLTLPPASLTSFWLDGSAWEIPSPDNADVFVDRLERAGLLVHDPVVVAALHDDVAGLSKRTVERRVARATGLTQGAIRQMQRADRAVELLGRGVPALEVARRTGYADQPHMTRSLKHLVGQTPSQIAVGV
jgi:AraC-like DNA-binding protein